MRAFTNKKGDKTEVSKEHLDMAVEIKLELQKASPSGRCSWGKLVKIMHENDFEEADNTESYRCLIKDYQKKIGKLPESTKHVDIMADKKIDTIKGLVGELAYEKRYAQNEFRKLNKVRREIIDKSLFVEEVRDGLKDIKLLDIDSNIPILEKKDNSMVVMMTDWHIGLKTDNYDYEIALKRVNQYVANIIHYAKIFDINEVKVVGVGDLVEGGYLRPTQAFDIEFTYSEQVVKATEIVNHFLVSLSNDLDVVYLGSVLGNHSRMYDKGLTVHGDSAENIVDASIKLFIKMLNHPRITIDDKKNSNFDIVFNTNNKDIKVVHGDLLKKTSKDKISKFISSDNVHYDLLLYGHFHHFSNVEENHNRSTVSGGCLQGSTDYSQMLGYETIPSQTIIIFEGDSNVIPIKVPLEVDYN